MVGVDVGAGVGLVLDVSHGRSEVVAAAMMFNYKVGLFAMSLQV